MSGSAQRNGLSGKVHAVAQVRDLYGLLYLIGANPTSMPPRRAHRLLKAAFGGAVNRRIGLWAEQLREDLLPHRVEHRRPGRRRRMRNFGDTVERKVDEKVA
jgi:hypothetical protein